MKRMSFSLTHGVNNSVSNLKYGVSDGGKRLSVCEWKQPEYIHTPSVNICHALQTTNNNDDNNKLCGRLPQYVPAPCKLTFDVLTLKVVSGVSVTWATSVQIPLFST